MRSCSAGQVIRPDVSELWDVSDPLPAAAATAAAPAPAPGADPAGKAEDDDEDGASPVVDVTRIVFVEDAFKDTEAAKGAEFGKNVVNRRFLGETNVSSLLTSSRSEKDDCDNCSKPSDDSPVGDSINSFCVLKVISLSSLARRSLRIVKLLFALILNAFILA